MLNKNISKPIHHKRIFIHKLYEIISNEINNKYIDWSVDGLSIVIIDKIGFTEIILKKYFKHSSVTSFMSFYGFKRKFHDESLLCYSHPLFKKGNVDFNITILKQANYCCFDIIEQQEKYMNKLQLELQLLSKQQNIMFQELNECYCKHQIASNHLYSLQVKLLTYNLYNKRMGDSAGVLLIGLVNGMKTKIQTNFTSLFDMFFPNQSFGTFSLSLFTTPIKTSFSPSPFHIKNSNNNQDQEYINLGNCYIQDVSWIWQCDLNDLKSND